MNQISLFSNGLELGNLVVNPDFLYSSWDAILKTTSSPFSVSPYANGTIISFMEEQNLQGEGKDLISSAALKERFPVFDFICTKVSPSFSINKAIITRYETLHDQLSNLEIDIYKPLIITGRALSGSVASLFTLWLLDNVYSKKPKDWRKEQPKPPICLTFGSPLLGDSGFQKAVQERPSWNSCFLNIVSTQDPVPRLFLSTYRPFGTFLFCSQPGCACFEEPNSVLDVLVAINSGSIENVNNIEYGEVLNDLRRKVMSREGSELGELNRNPLRAGITLQLSAIGILNIQQQKNSDEMTTLITNIEKRLENSLMSKRNSYEATKKLNNIKVNMTYMEWYKKVCEGLGGYYDCYRNPRGGNETSRQQEIKKYQRRLTQYWKDMVEKANLMPQEEGINFRTTWLYAGTNYRRMVEPLDIAYYYKQGNRDYINKGRSDHYRLLEQWMEDDKNDAQRTINFRNKACSMTEDSCFWARVEEAIISCRELKEKDVVQEHKTKILDDLSEFEAYLADSIANLSVGTEIFLEKSSFMKWWVQYDEMMGISHNSRFTGYMRNPARKYVSLLYFLGFRQGKVDVPSCIRSSLFTVFAS